MRMRTAFVIKCFSDMLFLDVCIILKRLYFIMDDDAFSTQML